MFNSTVHLNKAVTITGAAGALHRAPEQESLTLLRFIVKFYVKN